MPTTSAGSAGFAGARQPLYEIKANLFKALAHPIRIRVLEILSASGQPTPVSDLLAEIDVEPTLLSQHLAVLKRHHVVSGQRQGNAVFYELAHPKVSELLVIARTFLADTLREQRDHLAELSGLPPVTAEAAEAYQAEGHQAATP